MLVRKRALTRQHHRRHQRASAARAPAERCAGNPADSPLEADGDPREVPVLSGLFPASPYVDPTRKNAVTCSHHTCMGHSDDDLRIEGACDIMDSQIPAQPSVPLAARREQE